VMKVLTNSFRPYSLLQRVWNE